MARVPLPFASFTGDNTRRINAGMLVFLATAALSTPPARAEDKIPNPSSIWERDKLTGTWGGARDDLQKHGVDIAINDVDETFAVLSGGVRQKASYEGQLEFSIDADLSKAAGWTGSRVHATVFQIRDSGKNVAENVGSIADPSNIDAAPTVRLYTMWFEQDFTDGLTVRIGQLVADGDFGASDSAGGLLNGTFGWAGLMAADMTNGGPAYPLATPGIHVEKTLPHDFAARAGVFAGDPAGRDCDKAPQKCNKYGTTFSLSGGSLWMGELQYGLNQGKQAPGLAGTYKIGAWYQTARFADQHYGTDGSGALVSLGVDSTAEPLQHSGDWGFYGVADQMVWRAQDSSVSLFLRGGFAPADRNLVSFYADGGTAVKGLFPGRRGDVLTLGVAYAEISRNAAAADRDARGSDPLYPIRSAELVFELSYSAQVAPWWMVQPDLQYIVHPGGNIPDPDNSSARLRNAFVAGVRSTINF